MPTILTTAVGRIEGTLPLPDVGSHCDCVLPPRGFSNVLVGESNRRDFAGTRVKYTVLEYVRCAVLFLVRHYGLSAWR